MLDVLLVVPQRGWAFELFAQQVARYVPDISARVLEFSEVYRTKGMACDILIPWWWKWLSVGQLDNVKVHRGTIGCLYDAWSWTGARPGGLLETALGHMDVLAVANDQFLGALRGRFSRLPPAVVCPDAVDGSLFHAAAPRWPGQFTALWVGNSHASMQLGEQADLKGYGLVTEACSLADVPLVKADLAGDFIPQTGMPAFYESGHVLVVGSLSEGGPRPLLEAASMGRGLVATRVGLVPRVVAHGCNGVICDRTAAALADGLRYMRAAFQTRASEIWTASRLSARQFEAATVVRDTWARAIHLALTWGRPHG